MSEKAKSAPTKQKPAYMGLMGILGIGAFFPATAFMLICGLVPTYVAWLSDRSKGKLISITVGALNIAATTPLLMQLWDRGNTVSIALKILLSPFSWILLLAGAGVGWVLAQVLPLMIVGVITSRDKTRLERIRARQKLLVDEWGNAITEIPGEKKAISH